MKNCVKTLKYVSKFGNKTSRKTNFSFDNALKGLGVVNKWNTDLEVKNK